MKAMLLAGGLGTRLRPLTDTLPKCMIPVHNIPLLEHNIRWIRNFGITEFVINVHHLPEVIMNYFQDGKDFGVNITYSIETVLLGTAGSVKNVENYFNKESFLVWYGDNLSTCNLCSLIDFHKLKKGIGTIALYNRDGDTVVKSSIVGLNNNNLITLFKEKPKLEEVFTHLISAGIIIFEPEIFDYIPNNIYSDFGKDIFPLLVNKNLYGYKMNSEELLWWIDTKKDLINTEKTF